MRIPTTESRRGLDTGASTLRTPRVSDAVGRAVQRLGGAVAEVSRSWARQQQAAAAIEERSGLLDLQNALNTEYRTLQQNASESGAGFFEAMFSGDENRPGVFDQLANTYLGSLPEDRRAEAGLQVQQLRNRWENTVANEQLTRQRTHAVATLERQTQAAELAVAQNPAQLDAHSAEIAALAQQFNLSPAVAGPVVRELQQRLAMAAARGEISRDPQTMQQRLERVLGTVGQSGGPIDQLVAQIVQVESGGDPTARNPRSTATGAGQFIEATWLDFIADERPDLAQGRSRAQILALRNDPTISRQAVAWYARENEMELRRAGLPVTAGTLYLAHFAGPQGAIDLLRADPSASARSVLGASKIRANPFLRGRSAQWVVDWAARKMNDTEGPVTQATADDPILSRLSPSNIATLGGLVEERQSALEAARTQELASLNDNFRLRIATDDVSLTEEDILSSSLDQGDQATLIRSLRSAQSERREAAAYAGMLQEGGGFDPFDTRDRNGVSRAYESIVGDHDILQDRTAQQVAQMVYERSGIVPERVHNRLRQAARSTDPRQIAVAGQIALNLATVDPGGLTVRNGGGDIERLATQFRHYTRNWGYPVEQASEIIASLNDPQLAASREALLDSEPVKAALEDIDEVAVLNVFDGGIIDVRPPSQLGETPEASAVIMGEYRSIYREEVALANGDLELAKATTDQRIRSIYGASELTLAGDRTVTRYPPELAYPPVGGSHDYIREQLMEAIEAEDAELGDDVRLQYTELTENAVLAGRPAPYDVWYKDSDGVWQLFQHPFVASYEAARERWATENLESSRERRDELREGLDGVQDYVEWLDQRGQHMLPGQPEVPQ